MVNAAPRHLLEGAVTVAAGLLPRLFAADAEVPVVTPAEVGVVLMCVGGAQVLRGLYRSVRAPGGSRWGTAAGAPPARTGDAGRRESPQRSPPGTHSTSPVSLFAVRARMNSRSERRLR
nr:DUF5708 family protein [Streptomyces harenosi]